MPRYLITSALPYINGIKHLGNLVGSLLPADVHARYLRSEGEQVLFVCATDEHGTPAEIAALEDGLAVEEYCDRQHQRQAEIYAQFGLSFDHFGRTSAPANHELTRHMYRKLADNGYVVERTIEQIYSPADGRFLPDRYVSGTCPRCGYESARGDQCENCTSVLDPDELIDARSTLSGSRDLEMRLSQHLFIKLDSLSDDVRKWVESHGDWPKLTSSVALKWLNEGLRERCITRDLVWGVPVPETGFEDKVFYVWFDAPIGYVGATKEWADAGKGSWEQWWLDQNDVEYVQFMAKDNLPFHTVFFPATLMGTGEPWTMATYIKGFNWLTYYGGKFSTSQGRGVFMDHALEILPADYWRYCLLAQAPESDDSDFTWDLFSRTVNKDLAGNFGNFVFRVLKLSRSKFGDCVPAGGDAGEREQELALRCKEIVDEYRGQLASMQYRKAIAALRSLWSLGNVYIDECAPWSLVKTDPDAAAVVLRTSINLVRAFAVAAWPIIPFTAEKVLSALGEDIDGCPRIAEAGDLSLVEAGREFSVPDVLFRRLDDAEVSEYEERFSGSRS